MGGSAPNLYVGEAERSLSVSGAPELVAANKVTVGLYLYDSKRQIVWLRTIGETVVSRFHL
jgi:hypothetical protein